MGLGVLLWPPVLVAKLLTVREFVREALDAHRRGERFSQTRELMPGRVSITVPFVRVQFNELSFGLGIDEAAELAGVDAPPVHVPPPAFPRPAPMPVPMFFLTAPPFELPFLDRAGGGSARAPRREELGLRPYVER